MFNLLIFKGFTSCHIRWNAIALHEKWVLQVVNNVYVKKLYIKISFPYADNDNDFGVKYLTDEVSWVSIPAWIILQVY